MAARIGAMLRRRPWRWWLVGALVFVYGLPGTFSDGLVWWGWVGGWLSVLPWTFATLGVVVVLATGAAVVAAPKQSQAVARPSLRAGELTDETREARGGKDLQVLSVAIFNAADSGGDDATAFEVVPKVEALDLSGNRVTSVTGAWGKDVYGQTPAPVTFRPTHEEHPLELVAKFPADENAYLAGQKDPWLSPGEYKIRASLRGRNLDAPVIFSWRVRHKGKNSRLELSTDEPGPLVVRTVDAAPSASVGQTVTVAKPDTGSKFPNLEIVAKDPLWLDPEVSPTFKPERRSVVFISLRVTNREQSRPANLHFELEADVDHPFPRQQSLRRASDLAEKIGLPDPLKVAPLDTETGDAIFEWGHELDFVFGKDVSERDVIDQVSARLHLIVTDYLSGQQIRLKVGEIWRA